MTVASRKVCLCDVAKRLSFQTHIPIPKRAPSAISHFRSSDRPSGDYQFRNTPIPPFLYNLLNEAQ